VEFPALNLIKITELSIKKDHRLILDSINLNFQKGEIYGLLGPSGSGKTTLMRSMVGLQKLTQGKIEIMGFLAGDKKLRNTVGFSTQTLSVYDDLTVIENLRFFSGLYQENDKWEISELIKIVSLTLVKNSLVRTLSGGERARLSLATALISKPKILILDEPTVGLDPVLRAQLWEIFRGLAKTGTTLIISSHVMDEADQCEKIILLRGGKVLATGTPEELRATTGKNNMEQVFIELVEQK
jgi:ABC-2 type transport system ATP-binding protein